MKRFFILLILTSFLTLSFGQVNLAPNGSFETYTLCPSTVGQLPSEFSNAANWWGVLITPDYYNTCATNTVAGVPSNWNGYQLPSSGNAYAGMYSYTDLMFPSSIRESVTAQLTSPMVIGQKYYVKIMLNASLVPSSGINSFTNKMGLLFSTNQFSAGINPHPINNFAHVYSTNVISDSLNWIKIFSPFVADSNYNYVSVGNFFLDANTTIQTASTSTAGVNSAYFFFDDICISTDSSFCYDWNYTTDIAKLKKQEILFKVYPNPSTTKINIEFINPDNQFADITIINQLGEIIYKHKQWTIIEKEIPIDNLSNGSYFIQVKTKYGQQTEKLIIIR